MYYLNYLTKENTNDHFPQIALASPGGKRQKRERCHYSLSNLNIILNLSVTADQESIRKELTEQYTVKIQDYELKLSNAEAKLKGNTTLAFKVKI